MPFKKMKGGAGRQRTEPAVNGPLTTGRSVILQNTQMASPPLPCIPPGHRGADGPGGIQGLPRLGTVKQNQNCVFCMGTRDPVFSYRFSSGTEFRFPTLVMKDVCLFNK